MEIVGLALQVASTLAGGVITFIVSRWYYRRAAVDLTSEARKLEEQTSTVLAEAAELRRLNLLLMRYLETDEATGFSRDSDGNPIGLRQSGSFRADGVGGASFDVTPKKE